MSHYIAAYDVSHPSQRRKVADRLSQYGVRIQLSVFEVDVEAEELPTLRREIGLLLSSKDRFDLVPIDADRRRPRLVWQQARIAERVIFL